MRSSHAAVSVDLSPLGTRRGEVDRVRCHDGRFPLAKGAGRREWRTTARIVIAAGTALPFLLFGGGTPHAQVLACGGAQKPQQVVELMFGRKVAGRMAVTEDEWTSFLDQEITPRFPDGLTVFNAAGQWRDQASNKIVREPSKIVLIVLPGKAEDLPRVNEIAQAYKTRFKQPAVGIIVRPACVSF